MSQKKAQIPVPASKGYIHAHAHNDYEHDFPLWQALHNGFNSVEADVWLIKGKLYVKHLKPRRRRKTPTLTSLYLAPLKQLYEKQKGGLYPNLTEPFLLMIDVKSEAVPTYQAIKAVLRPYEDLLAGSRPFLKIFISGNRALQYALKDTDRVVGMDGRPGDLQNGYSTDFMPVISERYAKVIKWNGKTEIPEDDRQTLHKLVKTCHEEGKKLRLWASPETELCWKTLLEIGVDLINTDKLVELNRFLEKRIREE